MHNVSKISDQFIQTHRVSGKELKKKPTLKTLDIGLWLQSVLRHGITWSHSLPYVNVNKHKPEVSGPEWRKSKFQKWISYSWLCWSLGLIASVCIWTTTTVCAHLWLTSYTSVVPGLNYRHSAELTISCGLCIHSQTQTGGDQERAIMALPKKWLILQQETFCEQLDGGVLQLDVQPIINRKPITILHFLGFLWVIVK